jgi:NifB/MoaA-like Fe-S oxidoreductase
MKYQDDYIVRLEKAFTGFLDGQTLSGVQKSTGLTIELCEEVYSLSKSINKS